MMGYELYEGFANGGLFLSKLSEAAKSTSDGGTTITLPELIAILAEVGVVVAGDIADKEPGEE